MEQSPEILSHKHGQLCFDKGTMAIQQRRTILSKNSAGKVGHLYAKDINLKVYLTSYAKSNSKWNMDLSEISKTKKTLRRKLRRKYSEPWVSQRVLRHNTKSMILKRKNIDKLEKKFLENKLALRKTLSRK